jgi:hypothetical protein
MAGNVIEQVASGGPASDLVWNRLLLGANLLVDTSVLTQFEINECIDHRVVYATDDIRRDAFVDGQLSKPRHHCGAAIRRSHRMIVALVACGLFDESLAERPAA